MLILSEKSVKQQEKSIKLSLPQLPLIRNGRLQKWLWMSIKRDIIKSRKLMIFSQHWKITWEYFQHRKLHCFMNLSRLTLRPGRLFCRIFLKHQKLFCKCKDNGFIQKVSLLHNKMNKINNLLVISLNSERLRSNFRNTWLTSMLQEMSRQHYAKKGS